MAEEEKEDMFKDFFKEGKEEKPLKTNKGRTPEKDDIRINLVLKKRDIERAIYIAVILLLIILYFFFPYTGGSLFSLGGISFEKTESVTVVEVNQSTEEEPTNATAEKVTTVNETVTPIEEQEASTSSGDLTISINRVYSEKKDWGGLITQVVYTIDNQKETINDAALQIFVYDADSETQWLQRPRERVEFDTIDTVGFTRTASIAGAGVSFTDLTNAKTVKIALVDSDNKVIDIATEEVMIT